MIDYQSYFAILTIYQVLHYVMQIIKRCFIMKNLEVMRPYIGALCKKVMDEFNGTLVRNNEKYVLMKFDQEKWTTKQTLSFSGQFHVAYYKDENDDRFTRFIGDDKDGNAMVYLCDGYRASNCKSVIIEDKSYYPNNLDHVANTSYINTKNGYRYNLNFKDGYVEILNNLNEVIYAEAYYKCNCFKHYLQQVANDR